MNFKKKYYVVWKGRETGIFDSWEACKMQVHNFKGAQYKSFSNLEKAKQAYYSQHQINSSNEGTNSPIQDSICVDGAFDTQKKIAEYKGIYVKTNEVLFKNGPFENAGINLVEFLAIVHALAYCKEKKLDWPIYSDSNTAISWVRNKKINTKIERTSSNKLIFDLIDRALLWLEHNTYSNKILKWETDRWGENPADFGRK
jgi:ribonuclease HI